MRICATAATPFAALLLIKGFAPGAVIAFLLTGPATNVTTFGAVKASHGKRATLIILAAILGAAVASGYAINAMELPATSPALDGHEHEAGWVGQTATAIFILLLFASLIRQGPRGFLGRLGLAHGHRHPHGHHPGHDHGHDHDHDHGHDHDHDHDHDHGNGCGQEQASSGGGGCC